jgi:hypothetical protein
MSAPDLLSLPFRVGGTECRLSQPQADKFDIRPDVLAGRPRET